MNAKVLATIMFVLVPCLALAQSSDQTKSRMTQSGDQAGQGAPAGKNGNGSDANGAATPGGGGRRKRDHRAIVQALSGSVNKTASVS
jgi:hypothetical protein